MSIWFRANKVSLNLKAKFMVFTPFQNAQSSVNIQVFINDQNLDHVKETVFLGVTVGLKHRSQATGEVRSVALSHVNSILLN